MSFERSVLRVISVRLGLVASLSCNADERKTSPHEIEVIVDRFEFRADYCDLPGARKFIAVVEKGT